MISLGPLLGIEGDYQYSLVVLLPSEVDGSLLKLRWSFNGQQIESLPTAEETLQSNIVYRFEIPIPRHPTPYKVTYELLLDDEALHNEASASEWEFVVPGENTLPKVGFASCNGSSKKLPVEVSDTEYIMWYKLWEEHTRDRLDYSLHCLLLSGDQIYADPIWEKVPYFSDKGLLGWRSTKKFTKHKVDPAEREDLKRAIEKFYEELYIASWSKAPVSRVLASIPSAMMWDDHDIVDGWGSYPRNLQECDIFELIFEVAKRYFEILQVRTRSNPTLISEDYYSQKLSFRNFEILILDNRSFRAQKQIMSEQQYADLSKINDEDLFGACPAALEEQRVVLFAIPVPLAHLNYSRRVESWLRWLLWGDFRKSFHDDALDHWDHHEHEDEQKKLIEQIFDFGDTHEPKYVHIVSGDVHSAGAGRVLRDRDDRCVNQIVSSAIVHRPIPKTAQRIVDLVSTQISKIEGYTVKMDDFGVGEKAARTIYQRNFGFLFKADKLGLKYYLTLENSENAYEWDQPRKFCPSSDNVRQMSS